MSGCFLSTYSIVEEALLHCARVLALFCLVWTRIWQYAREWLTLRCYGALHYLKDKDLIEDLVQEAFTAYWMKQAASDGIDSPRAYLYTAVRNRCIDAIRRQRQDVSLDSLENEILPVEDDVAISDDEAVDNSVKEARIWSAIDRLPAKRRRIFLMSRRDGMKYSEIAQSLGLSENTVRNQISKALEAIRQGVKKVILFLMSL